MKLKAEGIKRVFLRDGGSSNVFIAVDQTDFAPREGALTEIVGRSGSGKTTLINMLCGLLRPSQGRVTLDGQDLYALPDAALSRCRARHFGVIPQGQTGLARLTTLENVLIPASMYDRATEEIRKRALSLMERLDILNLEDAFVSELSGGEQRRMAIARALVNEPEIIVADEPTGDLDDETTRLVLDLLKDRAGQGAAVIMVTHERMALSYADEVYRMDKGRLTPSDGEPCDV